MTLLDKGKAVKPEELNDSQWRSLLEGLVLAEYSLALGAGASLGSKNGLGADLLTGNGLRDKLLNHYGIPGGRDRSLRQIYDLAQQVAQVKGVAPKELIAPWFSGCSVPDWYGNLVTIPWRVIWNLNIDDVLINAYRKRFRVRARQELRSMSWRDHWTASRQPFDKVSAIQLHGDAKSRDLIFGSLEYLAAAKEGGAAHRIFSDEWASGSPVVVIGASLDDELDLAAPLLSDLGSEQPSIIVKPNFTEFDDFRLRQSGLIPVRMTAENFFGAVEEEWEQTLAAIEADQVPGTLGMSPMAVSFLRSFRTPTGNSDRWHDFYAGDEPVWADLSADLDFGRVLPEYPDTRDPLGHKGLRVYAFHGELSGTTTAEMRFLADVGKAGYEVLEYDGDGKFDPRAVHWMAKQGMRKVLRIGRLDDFGDATGELETLCDESDAPVTLVTSLRTSRLNSLGVHLQKALWAIRVPDRLSPAEVGALLDKLEEGHRLNILLDMNDRERQDFLRKEHNSSLIDSLASITRGKSFIARYEEAYRDVGTSLEQRILDVVMVASEARYELSLGLLARAAGGSVSEVRNHLVASPLVRLVRVSRSGVSARHWGLASRASRRVLTSDRRYQATIDIVLAAAPYVDPTTIRLRKREVSLCARLMDAQRVVDAFGSERAAELYGELEAEFAWNSRFWEQRALAELQGKLPRWERAEAWAREAVVRHEDSFSLNTLATVLLRRSVSSSELDEALLFEGLEVVDGARRSSLNRVTEHPYVTAFSYLRRGRAHTRDTNIQRRVDEVFNFWRLEVERSLAWGNPDMRKGLESLIGRYLREVD